jgi:hypothetical protein
MQKNSQIVFSVKTTAPYVQFLLLEQRSFCTRVLKTLSIFPFIMSIIIYASLLTLTGNSSNTCHHGRASARAAGRGGAGPGDRSFGSPFRAAA